MNGQRLAATRSAAAAALAVFGATALLAAAPAVTLAKLKPAADVRAASVSVHSLTIAWKDRSRGERGYQIVAGPRGGAQLIHHVKRKSSHVRIKGFAPGTVVTFSVSPCRKRRSSCGPARKGKPTATLLTPFNGPHAALQCSVFPADDPFNQRVDGKSIAPRSHQIIAAILGGDQIDLHPDFGSNPHYGIPYVVVPHDQPGAQIRFTAYGNESDKGPYPIPPGAPIEGGTHSGGDRHVLVVRRPAAPGGPCTDYELYRSFDRGGAANTWTGDSGAIFDFGSPLTGQRPAGWTSADAAGLPIFPGLVTYEEVKSGEIDHAIRVTFDQTRRAYYPPATHSASDSCGADLPAMGSRLRLRAGYDISGLSGDARVIATALKRYGMIVADNGSDFYISGSTDPRWNDDNLNQLKSIPGSAFEVVKPDGPAVTDC